MSFHYSAEDIRVDDGHILRARLQDVNGDYQDAEIDLDNFIGNDNGFFVWDGQNFSASAEGVHFSIEGGGEVPVLRATLFDADGNQESRDINLSERISNNNGNFEFN